MTGGVIHSWEEKVDEGVWVREVRNFEYSTEDTAEAEDEQVQESEKEDSGLDTNICKPRIRESIPLGGFYVGLIFDTS